MTIIEGLTKAVNAYHAAEGLQYRDEFQKFVQGLPPKAVGRIAAHLRLLAIQMVEVQKCEHKKFSETQWNTRTCEHCGAKSYGHPNDGEGMFAPAVIYSEWRHEP